jgi:hypothetical protein
MREAGGCQRCGLEVRWSVSRGTWAGGQGGSSRIRGEEAAGDAWWKSPAGRSCVRAVDGESGVRARPASLPSTSCTGEGGVSWASIRSQTAAPVQINAWVAALRGVAPQESESLSLAVSPLPGTGKQSPAFRVRGRSPVCQLCETVQSSAVTHASLKTGDNRRSLSVPRPAKGAAVVGAEGPDGEGAQARSERFALKSPLSRREDAPTSPPKRGEVKSRRPDRTCDQP